MPRNGAQTSGRRARSTTRTRRTRREKRTSASRTAMLIIEAHKEDYEGANYTSGRVHSDGKGDFLYGRFEARAKLPRGQRHLGCDLDVAERPVSSIRRRARRARTGRAAQPATPGPTRARSTSWSTSATRWAMCTARCTTKPTTGSKWEQRKGRILLDDVDEEFHVYALEWTPERIDVFVDDSHYFTYINEDTGWRRLAV